MATEDLENETVTLDDESVQAEAENEDTDTGNEAGQDEAEANSDDAGEEDSGEESPKPKQPKKTSWEMRRIHEETNKRRAAEKRAAELEAQLEKARSRRTDDADDDPPPARTPEVPDLDSLVEQRASQKVAQEQYTNRINSCFDAGYEKFGKTDFAEKCNLIADLVDTPHQDAMLRTVTDPEIMKNGHEVIAELANNPEDAERILTLSPARMAIELAKMSERLASPKPAKPVSKAPPPIQPVGGKSAASSDLEDPDMPMDRWAEEFNKRMVSKGQR